MSETRTSRPVPLILAPMMEGRVAPGSSKARALIEEALRADPDETVRLIRPISPEALREGMRAAAIPERRIAELLRTPALDGLGVSDPFLAGSGSADPTPYPDPVLELERGPRPGWAGR